jgi:hypothetical protein
VGRVWLRVALAAGAGLASLMVCSGALVAIALLLAHTTDLFVIMGSGSWPSPIFWVGLVILLIVAAAGLSLPARALGAKRDHVTNTALLSGLGICAFVFFLFASLANPYVGVPLALMAIVATPLIGSLFAIREDYRYTVVPVRATVIAAVAVYCASLLATLLAIWLGRGGEGWWLYSLVPVIVASTSWLVVPAIVAALRPG